MTECFYAAVDLGAESGRVVRGRVGEGTASLEVVHRFVNRPVRLPDGLHWNPLALLAEILDGLGRAAEAPLRGVGVDAWGVDYALLGSDGRMLGIPFHYRDRRTEGVVERVHHRVAAERLYAATGIQTMPINTIFQLMAEAGRPELDAAERIALIPDLIAYWLTGEIANESTAASTTGLLDAGSGRWASGIAAELGLPAAPFSRPLMEPGSSLAPILEEHRRAAGDAAGTTVHVVAGHDTASAFAAAPLEGSRAAVLSSGTWSLLGLELPGPVLGAEAFSFNFSNERGVDGRTRLLRNVMGLWLVQECRRAWSAAGAELGYDELNRLAADADADVPLFDPDLDDLLAPGDMPARIRRAIAAGGQAEPREPGDLVRSILVSLACKYRLVLERLERVSGVEVDVLHVIGGGARNDLLCQMTADLVGRPVLAGPVEATALGNVLLQARAVGQLQSLAEQRQVAAAAAQPVPFEPRDVGRAAEAYGRFLSVTGLRAPSPALTSVPTSKEVSAS